MFYYDNITNKGRFGIMFNISSKEPLSNIDYWSKTIKERNRCILNNQYSVIDGGIYTLGDTYIIGENHLEASKYLEEKYNLATSSEIALSYEKETEQKFKVQIWDSTDFAIDEVERKIKKIEN